ncbi:PIN domain-containing protein [cf. Phormidesmis sp. LEGE 11477]|uniref:type II toxin-antitoxin system VapC family toxin n=1 Tax=cf. Phormidesmis sp. LEGE 11477 TaxID=1828680 RepID=UPI00188225D2|nr:type II toxin-antitoxin system VapC family toxin [cf. Phormidesmis sp. LEGE 11477]
MLLDTSGLLCYLHRNELQHDQAVQLIHDASDELLTQSYVLAELVALSLVRRFPRPQVLAFITDLVENPDVEMIWVNQQLNQKAMELLAARKDKTYSLCDAVSFVLMRQYGMSNALTTDRHFEQEGFVRLLPPPV